MSEGHALPAIVELDAAACRELLERQRQCILAVVDGDQPYAVPVYFGFDGRAMYLGVSEGRKTRALDANSRVHVVVTEPGPGDAWRSVAVAGRAQTLTGDERAHGIAVLVAHNRRFSGSAGDAPRPARHPAAGRVIRIDDAVVTGRMRPGPDEFVQRRA